MKIKSGGYFGKNISFTCERCNCVYEVESKKDWEIGQVSPPTEYGFKKIPEYNVICPKCKYRKCLGYQMEDAPFMGSGVIDLLSEREDWEERFRVKLEGL